jgi:hypothetical protein
MDSTPDNAKLDAKPDAKMDAKLDALAAHSSAPGTSCLVTLLVAASKSKSLV